MTNMPYQGISSFLKSPINDHSRQFGFMGIPYDCSVSFRGGARSGPEAVRSMSKMLTDGLHREFEVDPADFVSDFGDIAVTAVAPEKALRQIEDTVDQYHDKHMVFSGGDHLTTLGVLRSLYKKHGKMALIHFDCHNDCWSSAFGETYGHGTFLYNAIEEGLVDPKHVISSGLNCPVDLETKRYLQTRGGTPLTARHCHKMGPETVIKVIRQEVSDLPTYITWDIDFFDPAYAPSTGTPEPGGQTSAFGLEVLEGLKGLNLIGMDVVEIIGDGDPKGITALLGANLLHTYLAMVNS